MTSAVWGTSTTLPSIDARGHTLGSTTMPGERTRGHGLGQVGGVAVRGPLRHAAAGPLEVDVRRVRPAEQLLEPDRLVQVVVLVVHLDLDARVGRLELGRDVVPDRDRRPRPGEPIATRSTWSWASAPPPAQPPSASAAMAAMIRQHVRRRSPHVAPPSSSGTSPGRNIVPVRSDKVISNTSPNTRTRARRSLTEERPQLGRPILLQPPVIGQVGDPADRRVRPARTPPATAAPRR